MKQKLCLNCGLPVEDPANDLCNACGAAMLESWEKEPPIIHDRKRIAEILRDRRKELGYTQNELGSMIGVKQQTVQRIERGKFFISTKLLLLILEALQLSIVFRERGEEADIIMRE